MTDEKKRAQETRLQMGEAGNKEVGCSPPTAIQIREDVPR